MNALKLAVAGFFGHGASQLLLKSLGRRHIRAVNYHDVTDRAGLEMHLRLYKSLYCPVTESSLLNFLNGRHSFGKPGIILCFDDGLASHYRAARLLEKHGFCGWFFVSPALVGKKGHLSKSQLKEMSQNHVIGSHTMTHMRLKPGFAVSVLKREIEGSRLALEKILAKTVVSFCWPGGELRSYSREAAHLVRTVYRYAFQSTSSPIRPRTDRCLLQRTNVESDWPLYLVRFQVSGIMDAYYLPKRLIVQRLTGRQKKL